MITHNQLLERILKGRLILVGEARGSRIESNDIVDRQTGEVIQQHQLVYAVECAAMLGTVLLYRSLPAPTPELELATPPLEKGQFYAFELDRLSRGRNSAIGYLGVREPELVMAS